MLLLTLTLTLALPELRCPMQRKLPPHAFVARDLRYDPETGQFFWRQAGRNRNMHAPVGYMSRSRGRRYISLYGNLYAASRVAYLLMVGEDPGPGMDMDHVNGDCSDDRWSNLRLLTHSKNLMNRRVYGTSSGWKGVYKRGEKYVATVHIGKVQNYLGRYDDPREAAVRVAEYYRDNGLLEYQPQEVRDLLECA